MSRSSAQALKKNALKSTPSTVVVDSVPVIAVDDAQNRDEAANAEVDAMARIESANRDDLIRQAAYRRFKERGTPHGDEVQDWLEAEAEINQSLVE